MSFISASYCTDHKYEILQYERMTITPGSFTNFNPSVFGGFSEQGESSEASEG